MFGSGSEIVPVSFRGVGEIMACPAPRKGTLRLSQIWFILLLPSAPHLTSKDGWQRLAEAGTMFETREPK